MIFVENLTYFPNSRLWGLPVQTATISSPETVTLSPFESSSAVEPMLVA
ncbi:MAG: hypothetical protein LIO40_04925 [Ruminococcus sp.]|nr:hypothetical protein [Ruminococcus sp.]